MSLRKAQKIDSIYWQRIEEADNRIEAAEMKWNVEIALIVSASKKKISSCRIGIEIGVENEENSSGSEKRRKQQGGGVASA